VALVATRAEGLRRLEAFLPRAGADYASQRNTDRGPGAPSTVSGLSPYLRYRLLTEAETVAAVTRHHGPQDAAKFVQEVAWRTYWKGWLELRPAIWTRFVAERDSCRGANVAQAEAGGTGIECFDAWARELTLHGTLHNHARMWFASIWIFTLRLPWVLGADFLLRHLLDADPASNTLSWRWVAGLQTPGKTYLATAENIARFTDGRFHPRGLATQAIALTEPPVPPPRPLPALRPWRGEPALLLVTPEDLCPESLIRGPIGGTVVAGGTAQWPWGDKAGCFVAEAAQDAAARLGTWSASPVTMTTTLEPRLVIAEAGRVGAQVVVTPYAPVGPIADALDALAVALDAAGLPLIRVRRDWDERVWPYATKGYFAFKSCLPTMDGSAEADRSA
jgi:deoxyribodipyrimidine photo-lyase